MIGVLDPATPYPYLLYTLAGAGIVAYLVPKSVATLPPVLQSAYYANPFARILAAVVYWLLWPFMALMLVVALVCQVAIWVLDLLEDDK